MNPFWRTSNGLSRTRLALRRLVSGLCEDMRENTARIARQACLNLGIQSPFKNLASSLGLAQKPASEVAVEARKQPPGSLKSSRPIIFVSACVDKNATGGWKYNGGIKELNLLVKLLRKHNYEAFVMTYDGSYDPWLIDHQPHISMAQFRELVRSTSNVRCVTSWAKAQAFIDQSPRLFFWDMELKYTEHEHFPALSHLYKHKIQNVAAISRTIQAWHMAHFQTYCTIIPNLLDETRWMPDTRRRSHSRIGYMHEGPHTEEYLQTVEDKVRASGLKLEFQAIRGTEAEVLSGMQSCAVFLAMNLGKDPLWGEGCPRTTIEALSTGCVVLAFDIVGNREMIQDNLNSVLVPRYRPDLMADSLINLYRTPGEIERLRTNAQSMLRHCHTLESRWPAIRDFLELPNN